MRRSDFTIDNRRMTGAVILIGAPGSGKSSVLDALATRLEIDGVSHGAIESEQLAQGFPLLPGDSWTEQLAAVLTLQRDAEAVASEIYARMRVGGLCVTR
jgi:predicted ATPase